MENHHQPTANLYESAQTISDLYQLETMVFGLVCSILAYFAWLSAILLTAMLGVLPSAEHGMVLFFPQTVIMVALLPSNPVWWQSGLIILLGQGLLPMYGFMLATAWRQMRFRRVMCMLVCAHGLLIVAAWLLA